FSQWKIDQAGEGVLGFITNHSYLDNPTFRGMRQSLMNSFDEIYILDLHGNSLKKEKAYDGSKDENVFDIQQGVAVAFFIKHKKAKSKAIVHHEVYGLRETKYDWLNKHNIKNVKWNYLEPQTPFYFLIPRNEDHIKDYQSFTSIQEIFPINVTGIVTARDKFVIDFDELVLKRRIEEFRSLLIDNSSLKNRYKLKDTRGWKFKETRKALAKDENWDNNFAKILYRPFDVRSIYYSEKMVDWGRQEVMRHMLEPNISFCFMRQVSTSESYTQVLVSEHIVDNRTFFSSKGIIQQAPLYLYPETDKKDLFSEHETGEKKPNIKPELFAELKKNFKKEVTPEEIFYYIYAVLYSNTYRTKYAEFLKIDFPRVPFTKDYKLFIQLGKLGQQLSDLHLLKPASPVGRSKDLDNPAKGGTKFQGEGNNKVEKPRFDGIATQHDNGKVWINKEQYFDGVKEEVWKYQIGGYQVCEKWLKDRKERTLTLDEIKTYCKIVTSLSKTIELQKEIDKYFENVEKTV
ncbi:MAG: hypothetical protein PHC38_11505, partial [Weeksellaceae bacterium]|nr:hypothetical protein [Weeksellaceae bacterium]